MKATGLILALAVAIATAGPAVGQRASISVEDGGGKPRASFQAREKPYAPGTRAVASVYLHDRQDIVDKEGLAVTGFAFYGWREGAAVRVIVFSLVPAEGAPNRYLARPGDDTTNSLRLKEFATFTLSTGQAAKIDQMKALGLEPFAIRMTVQETRTAVMTGKRPVVLAADVMR